MVTMLNRCTVSRFLLPASAFCLPSLAFAQASPFDTGATSLVNFALTIATPIAVLIVIGLAIAAAVGKISWGWVIGAIVGIAAIFGAPQIVAWIRSLFGV
jgi:type IV secretory pathway VirB2 component (pilin)